MQTNRNVKMSILATTSCQTTLNIYPALRLQARTSFLVNYKFCVVTREAVDVGV